MASPSVFGWNGQASDSLAAVTGRRWGIALRHGPPASAACSAVGWEGAPGSRLPTVAAGLLVQRETPGRDPGREFSEDMEAPRLGRQARGKRA